MTTPATTRPGRFRAGLKFGLGLGLAGGCLDFLGNWMVVSRLPSDGAWRTIAGFMETAGGLASSCLMLVALPVAGFGLLGLCFARSRANALRCLGAVLVGFPLVFLGINFGERVRHQAFVALAARSAPVVQAIRAFTAKQGQPPTRLEELVPAYLPKLPGTGLCAYPGYAYLAGTEAHRFAENPWVLLVPVGSLDFDKFLYLPLQIYPERGFGGSLERIGDWAYVHE